MLDGFLPSSHLKLSSSLHHHPLRNCYSVHETTQFCTRQHSISYSGSIITTIVPFNSPAISFPPAAFHAIMVRKCILTGLVGCAMVSIVGALPNSTFTLPRSQPGLACTLIRLISLLP
jgi:hypothetical protein